jgi:flagellar basal body-associated protein FliL
MKVQQHIIVKQEDNTLRRKQEIRQKQTIIIIIIIIIIYLNCKWVFTMAVYYNKTQHTNNKHHSNNTPHSNNHSTQTIKETLYTMNTITMQQIQLKLQLNKININKKKYTIH